MSMAKRDVAKFNGETVQLSLKLADNRHQSRTFTGVRKIELGGNGKTNKHWYILFVSTESGVETIERVLDVERTGEEHAETVRELFPRSNRDKTVAEEHAMGNEVYADGTLAQE